MLVQSDQKVSVHLTITIHHQVHRDFLITLYVLAFRLNTYAGIETIIIIFKLRTAAF